MFSSVFANENFIVHIANLFITIVEIMQGLLKICCEIIRRISTRLGEKTVLKQWYSNVKLCFDDLCQTRSFRRRWKVFWYANIISWSFEQLRWRHQIFLSWCFHSRLAMFKLLNNINYSKLLGNPYNLTFLLLKKYVEWFRDWKLTSNLRKRFGEDI